MSGITGSPAPSARFGLLVVILIVVAIAAIVLVVLMIGAGCMRARSGSPRSTRYIRPIEAAER